MITGTMATLILVLALLGIVGFASLLVVGFRMWSEERLAKRAAEAEKLKSPEFEAAKMVAAMAEMSAAAEASRPPAPPAPEPVVEPPSSEPAQPAAEAAPPTAPGLPQAEAAAPSAQVSEPSPAPEAESKAPGLRLPFLQRGPAGQELLRVMRDPATGQFTIYVAGKPYANYHDIQNPGNEQAFTMAFHLLQAFSENTILPAPPVGEAETAPQTAEPPRSAPVAYRAAELPPPEMPSMRPLAQFRKMRGQQPPATKFVVKSITEQIEDHLQDKIARTPLARRGVHVRADTQGNALFLLEGKTYPTVEAVPDPEVQQVIREAISEWEKKK